MGPHPEAPVDVQKYIGSCLITQQGRSKRKSCPKQQHHHPKEPCNGYAPCGPGYNNISNYAWTGVPLISVARRGKGRSHPALKQPYHDYPPPVCFDAPSDGIEELLPIARLAIHAQGAPLILSPKDAGDSDTGYFGGPFKGHNFYHARNMYMFMSSSPDDMHAYTPRSSCMIEEDYSGLDDPSTVSPPRTVSSSPSHSDCISTTSEDSGTSENGLPRIIKPRKRRKKDRRTDGSSDGASSCSSSVHEETTSGPIVTLKPYQPLCYRYRVYPSPPISPKLTIFGKGFRRGSYPYPPSSRCQCPYCVPPPSTFLTPPDSPVEENLARAMKCRTNMSPCWSVTSDESNSLEVESDSNPMAILDDSSFPGMNALVLTSSHPPQRPWVYMTEQEPHSSCVFTVMCYNILCDKYATRQMYGYCPNWALDWNYRKKYILQEILHYKADIISLQEVETEQFYKFFLPELQKEGYGGIFSPKSRAKTMSECERKHVDGCAIFYRSDKFSLVREHLMEFNQLAMANAEGCDDMLNRVMTKDNIGLAALLQTKDNAYQPGTDPSRMQQALLVCTAHIHWDPEYSDVKLIQTMMLMHELKAFVDDILHKSHSDPNLIPLLLCGDFNSLPDSGVIEYLSSGRVSTRHCDFKEYVYKDCLSKFGNSSKANELTHPFQISRAYSDGIMPFTNYSYDFKGVIDYVFFSQLHMSVLGVLGPIDSAWLEENRIHGCPHPHVPSDHFPIVVELHLHPTVPLHLNGINLKR